MKVAFITMVAWLPFQIMYFIMTLLDPSDNIKVMNQP